MLFLYLFSLSGTQSSRRCSNEAIHCAAVLITCNESDSVQIFPWLSYSVPGVLNFGVLTINTAVAVGCYIACVLADPGRFASLHSA